MKHPGVGDFGIDQAEAPQIGQSSQVKQTGIAGVSDAVERLDRRSGNPRSNV